MLLSIICYRKHLCDLFPPGSISEDRPLSLSCCALKVPFDLGLFPVVLDSYSSPFGKIWDFFSVWTAPCLINRTAHFICCISLSQYPTARKRSRLYAATYLSCYLLPVHSRDVDNGTRAWDGNTDQGAHPKACGRRKEKSCVKGRMENPSPRNFLVSLLPLLI